MVERFNGRIEEVLQSHHFRSGEELEATLHRYVWLYNQQLPQSALGSRSPLQAMKDWHKLKPELFKKQPYYLPGCDSSDDPETKWAALDQIDKMGLDLADAMSVIYEEQVANKTDGPLAILELRRRQVMRDYETLQSRRPIDASRLDA
ncbi:Integrase, catalytic region [Roseobacter sp. AzwK-3b]|nr:Integrase, catalytic region [Roseobacter sp. AzwK-3b]